MKKCLIALFAIALAGCSSLTSAEKAERKAKTAQAVEKALAERHYKVEISMMNPRRGTAVNVSPDFSLEVKGDTLVSYLPYFGRAYYVPYGGGKGLNFTAPIKTYEDKGFSKGKRTISLQVNNGGEVIDYCLDVSDEGYANIDVNPRKRDGISFSGQMADKE